MSYNNDNRQIGSGNYDKTTDLIKTGQENQKGLIGAIALGVIAVGGLAIKAISGR